MMVSMWYSAFLFYVSVFIVKTVKQEDIQR